MASTSAKSIDTCPFPIGSIYITTAPHNPSSIWMQTYRVPFAKGRTLFCVDDKSKIETLKKVEQEGGAYTHQHELESGTGGDGGGDARAGKTKGASSMPPYITVFMRKRIDKSQAEDTKEFYNPFAIEDINKVFGANAIVDPSTISEEFPKGKPMETKPYYVG